MLRRLVILCAAGACLASCARPTVPVTIRFEARYDDAVIGCGQGSAGVALSDLRFYVQDLHLLAADGSAADLRLDADGVWQQADLALLDLEDGTGPCLNGTPAMHAAVSARVAPGQYRGLRFSVGVPFASNHADPLQAIPPLGDAAMHWHWRSGYKFLRAGLVADDDGFWIHLGSTGCEGTVRAISGCRAPNRVSVELPGFEPGRDVVIVELAALVSRGELQDQAASDCSSSPAETACVAPFKALGLDLQSGAGAGTQRVFRRGVPR
jgi:uncharacterized repeat protein (TIGR04052 family)